MPTPENSRITTDAEFERAVAAASSAEEIKSLMHDRAVQQGLVVPDLYSPDVLLPVEQPTPRRFGKAVTVDGQKRFFEADSELELEREIGNYFRETLAARDTNPERQQQQQSTDQPRDAATGRFTAEPEATTDGGEAVARAELELRFKRGEISTDEYLTASGAIERHLAAQGIDMNALREASAQQFHQSWAQATQEFLNSPAGRDWPGGEVNKVRLGQALVDMGSAESPSAENISRAYEYLRENDLLIENPEVEAHKAIASASSFEAVVEAARRSVGR
jgi:hypothetical protein